MAKVDLHLSARRKYEADDRRIVSVSFAKKGRGLDIKLLQLNHEDSWDEQNCPRAAEPHNELTQVIDAFRAVVLKLNELPNDMSDSIVISGITIAYTKAELRRITIKSFRRLSDGHLLPNNTRGVMEPPADLSGLNSLVFFPKDQMDLLEDLRVEVLAYVDGTQGMIAPPRDRKKEAEEVDETLLLPSA